MNVTNGNVVEFKEEGLYTSQPVFVPNPNGKVSWNLPMFDINKKSFDYSIGVDQIVWVYISFRPNEDILFIKRSFCFGYDLKTINNM